MAAIQILVSILLLKTFADGNPCHADDIPRGKYRGTECLWRDGKATHDRDIVQSGKWYKATDENGLPLSMPTKAVPNNLRCSTKFPIWMNGNNPTIEEGEVSYDACVSDGLSDCDNTYDIVVKNCTEYLVYKLTRPDNPDEAYCFGEGKVCPPPDPCEDIDRETLQDDGYRSATCSPTDLCDDNIHGWYLVQNSQQNLQMPMLAPMPGSCGAASPMWMDGQHPDQVEGAVSRKVCVVNTTHDCSENFQMNVINCGSFFVYELQMRSNCPQRYCFGTINIGNNCPDNSTIDYNNEGAPRVHINVTNLGVIVLMSVAWIFRYTDQH